MLIYFSGLMLGLSLITALGPQNIFLIRQGTLKHHAALSAIVCFICDLILVWLSVTGLNSLLQLHPFFTQMISWFGAAFLIYYGLMSIRRALLRKQSFEIDLKKPKTRWQILLLALGFSLLNPHAIIDSLIIIGSGSAQFPDHKYIFLGGVMTASLLWFSSLTLTTVYFSNILSRQTVWQKIELMSGLLMLVISAKLILANTF